MSNLSRRSRCWPLTSRSRWCLPVSAWAARPYWIGDLEPLGCTPMSLEHLIQGEHATLPPFRALTEAEESVSDTKCHNILRSETPHRRYLAVWRRLLFRRPLFPASIVQHCISTRLTMTEYTYERAQKRWRRSETVEILSIRDTQIALFPLSFVALGGDNTWSYILDTIQQLVEVAAGGAGVIMDEQNRIVDGDQPVYGGVFRYSQLGKFLVCRG